MKDKKYIHVGSIHLYWSIGMIVTTILCLIVGDQIGKWRTIEAYSTAKITQEFEYDSYRHESITTTHIHVPAEKENIFPWLTKPESWNEKLLCAYPRLTVVEKKTVPILERDADGYLKNETPADEELNSQPPPAPTPQPKFYYPPDPLEMAKIN